MFGFYDSYFIFFGLNITYYGLIIALGMAFGVILACKNANLRGLKTDDFLIIACYVLPLSIIGARIYYVIFSLDKIYSFWDVFKIWEGGMAIYGGVIGGAIGIILYCLIHKKNFLDVGDIAVSSLILGQAIGRIGCYFAGCCYGIEVTDPSLTWFPLSTKINGVWHLSTFFYECIWDLMVFAILIFFLRKNKLKYRGSLIYLYLILYGTGRAWIEALRGDSLYIGAIKVSQLLSILLILTGIIMIIVTEILHRKNKIKTLKDLQPVYELNIKSELEEKEKKMRLKEEKRKIREEKKSDKIVEEVGKENDIKINEKNEEDILNNNSQGENDDKLFDNNANCTKNDDNKKE